MAQAVVHQALSSNPRKSEINLDPKTTDEFKP
jgi:hypothetical protein